MLKNLMCFETASQTVHGMAKTTVILRNDLYDLLVKKHGRRKISATINEALEKKLLKPKKSMFGVTCC